MGVNCGATADIGRVIKSLPFGEAIYAARETLERKSRTHKLNHQTQDDKDQGTAIIVSPSEILYSMLVDRWELKDAALVAAQDAVRFGDEARRKVCEVAKDPQNATSRRCHRVSSTSFARFRKVFSRVDRDKKRREVRVPTEKCSLHRRTTILEKKARTMKCTTEKGSSESSQEEIVFEKLRIHNDDNDEGNDVARQHQEPPNDRASTKTETTQKAPSSNGRRRDWRWFASCGDGENGRAHKSASSSFKK